MTRADKIKAYVKERYGVEIKETSLEQTEFRFQECDGFECPPECLHEDCTPPECDKCKYNNFWEQEDEPRTLISRALIEEYDKLNNRGGLKDVLSNS